MAKQNTTAAARGAMLAKERLVVRTTPKLTVAQLENGNRLMRRTAAKQIKKSEKEAAR